MLCVALTILQLGLAASGPTPWRPLAEGVEYASFRLAESPDIGDGLLHAVRIDPARAELRVLLASEQGGAPRTAKEWTGGFGLTVAINAGMFDTDHRSNVGYLRHGSHVNRPSWNQYQSVLAAGPSKPGLPAAEVVDLDAEGARERLAGFQTVIQNLRLIKGEGQNVWKPNGRRWSEAALAMDRQGRLLFLFSRTPLAMHDFNRRVLELRLGVVRAMHLEGGPEASLSLRAKGLALDLSGSYETGFFESNGNERQWPIPNVIGVRPKRPAR